MRFWTINSSSERNGSMSALNVVMESDGNSTTPFNYGEALLAPEIVDAQAVSRGPIKFDSRLDRQDSTPDPRFQLPSQE